MNNYFPLGAVLEWRGDEIPEGFVEIDNNIEIKDSDIPKGITYESIGIKLIRKI